MLNSARIQIWSCVSDLLPQWGQPSCTRDVRDFAQCLITGVEQDGAAQDKERKHGFYSYDAKHVDAERAVLRVPADMPEVLATRIREFAIRSFGVRCCEAMARVDFFLTAFN